MEIQKFEYLESKKGFLDEINNIFQFLKGHHLVKNKILLKKNGQVLSSSDLKKARYIAWDMLPQAWDQIYKFII